MEKKDLTLDKLQEEVEKLLALLKDRQPGLMAWHAFLDERLRNLHTMLHLAGYCHGESQTQVNAKWREQDGVIYFSVTSDGTTGPQWIKRLEGQGFRVGDYAKQVLHSPDFKPTKGVTTEIAVLKGMFFENDDRITGKIRAEADKRKLTKPNAEVACLIREKFTDKEIEAMGLWWLIAMHEPIKDSDGSPRLLDARRSGVGRWLDACYGRPGCGWVRESGFAFVVSPQ